LPADDWKLLDDALAGALEQPEPERLTWLRSELAGNPETLSQAEILLGRAAEAKEFFDQSPVVAFRLAPGLRLGPWALERELGRGGMGAVWLARRADGEADMLAAVKFLNTPFATPTLLERFPAREADPGPTPASHIAQPAGRWHRTRRYPQLRPRIRRWPAGHRGLPRPPTPPQTVRVRLARKILDALQHAHSNLIVHRDLKPGNILCTASGVPKLLDFGIARLLEDSGEAARTETLHRALSIDYASPEQIRGDPFPPHRTFTPSGFVFTKCPDRRAPRNWRRRPLRRSPVRA
jgi:eukaryotic-like serine/threonine-protein kinase